MPAPQPPMSRSGATSDRSLCRWLFFLKPSVVGSSAKTAERPPAYFGLAGMASRGAREGACRAVSRAAGVPSAYWQEFERPPMAAWQVALTLVICVPHCANAVSHVDSVEDVQVERPFTHVT